MIHSKQWFRRSRAHLWHLFIYSQGNTRFAACGYTGRRTQDYATWIPLFAHTDLCKRCEAIACKIKEAVQP